MKSCYIFEENTLCDSFLWT